MFLWKHKILMSGNVPSFERQHSCYPFWSLMKLFFIFDLSIDLNGACNILWSFLFCLSFVSLFCKALTQTTCNSFCFVASASNFGYSLLSFNSKEFCTHKKRIISGESRLNHWISLSDFFFSTRSHNSQLHWWSDVLNPIPLAIGVFQFKKAIHFFIHQKI